MTKHPVVLGVEYWVAPMFSWRADSSSGSMLRARDNFGCKIQNFAGGPSSKEAVNRVDSANAFRQSDKANFFDVNSCETDYYGSAFPRNPVCLFFLRLRTLFARITTPFHNAIITLELEGGPMRASAKK